mgnify:CR=1 FL=1
MLNKSIIFIFVLGLIVLYGCTSPKTAEFDQGVKRINKIDNKFGSTMKTPPDSAKKVDELLVQLTGFSAVNNDMAPSLKYLLDFRIKNLEAEKLHIEGWQWGRGSTTDYGFGCRKGSARVLNSSKIRNASAQKGYESLESLRLLVYQFPKEAESVNLTQKDALILQVSYQQVEEKAARDAKTIKSVCREQIKELNITI